MVKSFVLHVIGLFVAIHAIYAQTYHVNNIPEELKKNAAAVYFIDRASHEIIHDQKAIYKVHYVVAIFNDKADHLAHERVFYDENNVIKSFEGKVYNGRGQLIKKTKKSDIYDRSAISGYSIYEDNRFQYLELEQNIYPYIVEFNYQIEYNQTYSIRDWYVNPSENVSVLKSQYTLKAPEDLLPRFKFENTDQRFESSTSEEIVTKTITFYDLPARESEPLGPELSSLTPVIRISPSKFNFEGFQGSFDTWKSLGNWQNLLNQGRDGISQETKLQVRELADRYDSKEKKIQAIYEYMQNRTRYVSIQLGIGGWRPFPASTVDDLGYGDCKALSNYTKALLQAVGIESYYTWVYGGKKPFTRELDTEFAMDVFNHIILCVPNENDTIWLECTNQLNPFGYQGYMTGDRDVMIVTPNGGKLAHTTVYDQEDNQQITHAHVSISEDGSSLAQIEITYTGLQYENGDLNWIVNDGDEKLKTWVYENTDISDFTVRDFEFKLVKKRVPSIEEMLEIEIKSLGTQQGKRLFIQPNLMNQWTYIPRRITDRETKVILDNEYQDTDSMIYSLPEKYHIEYLPEGITIENEFGKYESHFKFENHQLVYYRRVSTNKGSFPKESYAKYRRFREDIAKADKSKVVFIDKT